MPDIGKNSCGRRFHTAADLGGLLVKKESMVKIYTVILIFQ
jgi:hypothetical protein